AKKILQRGQDRRVVVNTMVHHVPRNPWRYHHRRYPHAILLKREAVLIVIASRVAVARRHRRRGSRMIIESAVLVPGDHQQALLPQRRTSDRVIGSSNQRFA